MSLPAAKHPTSNICWASLTFCSKVLTETLRNGSVCAQASQKSGGYVSLGNNLLTAGQRMWINAPAFAETNLSQTLHVPQASPEGLIPQGPAAMTCLTTYLLLACFPFLFLPLAPSLLIPTVTSLVNYVNPSSPQTCFLGTQSKTLSQVGFPGR